MRSYSLMMTVLMAFLASQALVVDVDFDDAATARAVELRAQVPGARGVEGGEGELEQHRRTLRRRPRRSPTTIVHAYFGNTRG